MTQKNILFDDLARMASGAAGAFMDVKREIETIVNSQLESFSAKMQLVSRDEFEAVKAMAEKAREENEALKKRLDALEKNSAKSSSTKKTSSK